MKAMVALAAAAAATVFAAAAPAESAPDGALTGDQLEAFFSDGRVYGTTPSGNTWLIDFAADGSMRGVTNKDSDVGKWWVEGDTLCRSWTAWASRDGKEQACFHVVVDEAERRVNYYNPDGTLYRSWRQ